MAASLSAAGISRLLTSVNLEPKFMHHISFLSWRLFLFAAVVGVAGELNVFPEIFVVDEEGLCKAVSFPVLVLPIIGVAVGVGL